jgi:CheY-like chemotaxis protein
MNNNLKILIVEDDECSRKLLNILVKRVSSNISNVVNGIEAVEECYKQKDLDLILMDIQMPKMNGLEATRKIREFNQSVIIIAQTAFALEGDKEKAIDAGCNDYITKPIRSDDLISKIHKYFE